MLFERSTLPARIPACPRDCRNTEWEDGGQWEDGAISTHTQVPAKTPRMLKISERTNPSSYSIDPGIEGNGLVSKSLISLMGISFHHMLSIFLSLGWKFHTS